MSYPPSSGNLWRMSDLDGCQDCQWATRTNCTSGHGFPGCYSYGNSPDSFKFRSILKKGIKNEDRVSDADLIKYVDRLLERC